MARMKRVKNVERDFFFQLWNGSAPTCDERLYVDLMQVHSLVNRVFARQGMNVLVQDIEIGVQAGGSFTASILRLPQHWACVNAWEKTMRHWMDQRESQARESGLESTRARYSDFKIFFDEHHAEAGVSENLIPQGYLVSGTMDYEWNPSQVVFPQAGGSSPAHEVYLHMLGPDTDASKFLSTSCGIIHGYAESRSRVQRTDPNIVNVNADSTLYGAMEDVAEVLDDVLENYQEHNHVPPYAIAYDTAFEYYPGGSIQGVGPSQGSSSIRVPGQFVDTLAVNATQNFNSDTTGSFAAPCGLLKILIQADGVGVAAGTEQPGEMVGGPLWMRIRLAPGHYQGIAAVPMQEVN